MREALSVANSSPRQKTLASDASRLVDCPILIVARSNHPVGGIVTYVADVAELLASHGARVTVAINASALPASQFDELRDHVRFVEYRVPRTTQEFLATWGQLVKEHRPRILHFNDHNPLAIDSVPRLQMMRESRPTTISTLHGDIASLGADASQARGTIRQRITLHFKRKRVRRFLRMFDRVISVSQAIAHALPATVGVDVTKVIAIPNGVDLDRFKPRWGDCGQPVMPLANAPVVLGCSGGLYSWKGFDVAIRATGDVLKSRPVELRIAGTGPEEDSLKRLAAELGIEASVKFLGMLDDMPAFLRQIDLLLCTSRTETSCYSQLEAMAAGLPSVCSRYADLAIRVRDGIDGFLVPVGDVTGFASAIEKIIAEPALYASMARAARDRVVEHYSRADYLDATLGVYRDLLVAHN